MKKLFNVFALIAIVAMLFASCSNNASRPATEADMVLLEQIMGLFEESQPSWTVDQEARKAVLEKDYEGTTGVVKAGSTQTYNETETTVTEIFNLTVVINDVTHTFYYELITDVASGTGTGKVILDGTELTSPVA